MPLVILSAMAAIGFASAGALAGGIKDFGSFDGTYAKRDIQPIPDQDRPCADPDRSPAGTSTNHGGLVDGFSVSVRDLVDLRQGTGPQQGYVIYSKGADQEVVKFVVTTTMKDGQPNTTLKGN